MDYLWAGVGVVDSRDPFPGVRVARRAAAVCSVTLLAGLMCVQPANGDGGSIADGIPGAAVHAVARRVGLQPLEPARLMDSRPGGVTVDGGSAGFGPVGGGVSVDLVVAGRGGVPASGVGAVVLNVTGIAATESTFVTVWPTGATR